MAIIEAVTLEGRYAVCWRRLLEAVRRNPSALYPVTIQLLSVPKLLAPPETTVEAGEVLKATYSAGLVDDASGANIERRYRTRTSLRGTRNLFPYGIDF